MKTPIHANIAVLLFCGLTFLAGCGGGGGGGGIIIPSGGGGAAGPALGTAVTGSFASGWAQNIPIQSGSAGAAKPAVFPGQANVWDLSMDFSLADGGGSQFDYALAMMVTSGVTTSLFPLDQDYSELTFMGPLMDASAGVTVAAVSTGTELAAGSSALAGTYSAYLNATSFSQLKQGVVLTSTAGNIIASWKDQVNICDGTLNPYGIGGFVPSYRVVALESNGTEHVLYSVTGPVASASASTRTADLTALAGKTITLAFEQKSAHDPYGMCFTIIDDVSVKDNGGTGTEIVQNGTFELGTFASWTTNTPAESQNVTSGTRSAAGLDVTRSFYTVPNKLWGRWVDVFSNPSLSTDVTATIHYQSSLGSGGCGIIYGTPAATPLAVTSWDDSASVRDIGWVAGKHATISFTSDSTYDCATGSPFVDVIYTVTVPKGGKLSIVNFIVMDGTGTGALASTTDLVDPTQAKATEIDAEIAKILANFWTDNQYRDGMTQEQINEIYNF